MRIRYRIEIDRDHDGSFSALDEALTDRVLELRWRLGLREPYDSIADFGRAEITLLNRDGAFSPERQRLEIGARLRILSDLDGVTRTHFIGFINRIDVDGGTWGDRKAVIRVADWQPWLDEQAVQLAPFADVSADEVIDALLDQARLRRAVIAGFCLIDVPGYNLIDSARIFPARNLSRNLQKGKTRFAYVGDWWRDDISIRRAIAELAASERGTFFVNRRGEAIFLNRHHALVAKTLAARFHDDIKDFTYSYGDRQVNRLLLKMTPREIGAEGSTLWQLGPALRIGQDTSLLLNVPLVDARDAPVGLLELEALEAAFHSRGDGRGKPVASGVSAEVAQRGFTSLQVRLSNANARDVFLTELRIIGRPLYRRDPLELVMEDGPSLHLYGLRQHALDLPALSDLATARAFAEYELQRRKQPAGAIERLTLDARDHGPTALRLTLFDRIRVSETQTRHSDREYFIIGEAHRVRNGGAEHEVIFTLEPADLTQFVVIDQSAIDAMNELIAPF